MKKPLLYEPFDSDGVAHDMRQDNGGHWIHVDDYEALSVEARYWRDKWMEMVGTDEIYEEQKKGALNLVAEEQDP